MPINTKAIKRRIKSVKNTKKITRAMEMVSAAKMRKAVTGALQTRTYATLARELLEHLAHIDNSHLPLLAKRPVKNLLVVLMSSNRGLCGSFNANIFKKIYPLLSDTANIARHRLNGGKEIVAEESVNIHVIGIGKKSAAFAKKYGYDLVAVFDALSERPRFDEVVPVSTMIIDAFKKREYDKVVVAFTQYHSSLFQEPKIRQMLPVSPHDLEKMLAQLGGGEVELSKDEHYPIKEYLFEPDFRMIAEYVLPRLVEVQLYQAILESAASEHSARMVAMKNASESAGDMIEALTLDFNKARQAAITQEIAEIAGGAAALG